MKRLSLFFAILASCFAMQAAVINCQPAGDLSWYYSQAQPGDTLLMADGVYDEAYTMTFDKEGVVIKAAEGAKPVIALTGEWTTIGLYASTTFDGIGFDGTNHFLHICTCRCFQRIYTKIRNLTLCCTL